MTYEKTKKRSVCGGCGKRRTLYAGATGTDICAECVAKEQCGRPKGDSGKQARAIATSGGTSTLPVLGWTVFWTVRETQVARPDLEAILDKSLGAEFMPGSPRKKRAVRRALEELTERGFIRRVESETHAAFILIEEDQDLEHVDIDLRKEAAIVLNKGDDSIEFRGSGSKNGARLQELISRYSEVHVAYDLRILAIQFLKSRQGVTLRDTGGIYFLVESEDVKRLRRYIQAVGGSFYALPVADEKAARLDMLDLVKAELERDLTLAAEELKRIAEADPTKVRDSTYEKRAQEFRHLRQKISTYADLLKDDAQAMASLTVELEEQVLAAMADSHKASPHSAEWPYRCRVRYSGSGDRKGKLGTVIGYPPKQTDGWVRVLFDDDPHVRGIAVTQLERVKAEK